MGRRKKKRAEEVSLFPFMSILACVIGILMLMITAMALGQIGKDKVRAADPAEQARQEQLAQQRIEEYKRLGQQMEADKGEMERLANLITNFDALRQRLEQTRAELAELEAQRQAETEQSRTVDDELARQQAAAERLAKAIEELQQQLAQATDQINLMKQELADRSKPPEEALVVIQPSGSGANLRPSFVECAASSVVLFIGAEPKRVPRGQLAQNPEFAKLLSEVKNNDNATMIFLVRPDGISTYNTARSIARSQYVKNGKLAIASQGELDLSRYQNR
jgi:uncharacterized phage infection (PIP) family protein YhgE